MRVRNKEEVKDIEKNRKIFFSCNILLPLIASIVVVCLAFGINRNLDSNSRVEEVGNVQKQEYIKTQNEIIFSKSWSADGVRIYVERRDGTIEWDIPVIENNLSIEDNSEIIGDEDSSEIMPLSYVRTDVDTLYASEHCNIGFSNYRTGASLGFLSELYPGDSISMPTFGWDSFECAVRASTYSTQGYSKLIVSHDVPIPAIR